MAKASKGRKRNGGYAKRSHGMMDDVLALAGTLASSRKDYAAKKLETLAESVRECSSALPGIPNMKAYASAAAESLEGLAGYVMESDLPTMVSDAREFARRHPMATLAGSIAAGVVIAQMIQVRGAPAPSRRGRGTA